MIMGVGIENLPKAKWYESGKQPGIKPDMVDIEVGLLQSFGLAGTPKTQWVDATSVKVPATADDPATVMLCGYPSVLHPGRFITGGLTDGRYRVISADATLDFDLADSRWGVEKTSQWYGVYAIAGDAETAFTLKAMPFMRIKSQASQVISLGNLTTPSTGIGYGFTANGLVGYKLYFISGASMGLVREISANNDDSGTAGTITYGGTALTLAEGDWFVVLPAMNFALLGEIFNKSDSDIREFEQKGNIFTFKPYVEFLCNNPDNLTPENITLCSPMAKFFMAGLTFTASSNPATEATVGDMAIPLARRGASNEWEHRGIAFYPVSGPCKIRVGGLAAPNGITSITFRCAGYSK
jgi:hypothetical protein